MRIAVWIAMWVEVCAFVTDAAGPAYAGLAVTSHYDSLWGTCISAFEHHCDMLLSTVGIRKDLQMERSDCHANT